MQAPQHILLIPGFFGFDNLGDLAYFAHVEEALVESAQRLRIDARVHVVRTLPTASLRQRAASVLARIAEVLAEADGQVHLIGHSSGGLDARMAVTPDLVLSGDHGLPVETLAARVRTVVTVATPHNGTPVASFFSGLLGAQLLSLLSIATSYVLRTGRLPADVLLKLSTFFIGLAAGGKHWNIPALERLRERMLADFGPERRAALQDFAALIARDQDLLPQITPAAIDVFNASTQDRPGVRYGCVVTQARGAGPRSFMAAGLSPYAHASHMLYFCLSQIAARMPADRLPTLTPEQQSALRAFFASEPRRQSNDGIVPTLAQIWGRILRGVSADHLDVIGHFQHPTHVPPHFDWLASGSGYTRADFLATWDAVAAFVFADVPRR